MSNGLIKFINSSNVGEAIQACKEAEVVGLDTETTALHPKDGRLRLIQLAPNTETVYILDAFKTDPRLLLPLFDGSVRFIGHNLAFDLRFLWSVDLVLQHGKNLFDSMIAGELLDAGVLPRISHALDAMCLRLLNHEVDKTYQTSDWSGDLSSDQLRYAAKDVTILIPLYHKLKKMLEDANLTRTMMLEMRCLPGMVWMTLSGIKLDVDGWKDLAAKNKEKVQALTAALAEETDSQDLCGYSLINWRSPMQVEGAFNRRFREQGKTVKMRVAVPCDNKRCAMFGQTYLDEEGQVVAVCEYHSSWKYERVPVTMEEGTGSRVLAQLAADGDSLAKLLLQYRKTVKSRDTYGLGFLEKHLHADGRIYSEYRQLGAFSGRMSSTNPNGQNIPHSFEFRSLFVPTEGMKFALADYSQIELRICVEMSRDPAGFQAYVVDNTDLHKTTAEMILGVDLKNDPPERIKEARQVAKSLNFGLIFGAGSETLRLYAQDAFGVILTPDEAVRLRNKWREIYKGIVQWQKVAGNGPEVTHTLGGRRRLNVTKFTEKLNTPVQGTGADGLKAGIALCYERRSQINSEARPVAYVHDEILMETPERSAEDVSRWIAKNMQDGMSHFLKDVPVLVEPLVIPNWGEK